MPAILEPRADFARPGRAEEDEIGAAVAMFQAEPIENASQPLTSNSGGVMPRITDTLLF